MSNTDIATVMVPESGSIPHKSLLTPASLKPKADRLQWSEEVRNWAENIVARTEGGQNRAKGMATCLGLTVYRSLDLSLKEHVKEETLWGEIVLKTTAKSNKDSQLKILERIIAMVSKDTPPERVKRMV